MPSQLSLFPESSPDREEASSKGDLAATFDQPAPSIATSAAHRPESSDLAEARHLEERLSGQLESRLAGRLGRLILTNNRSTLITARPHPDGMHIRLHWSFVEADSVTLDALVELAQGSRRGAAFRRALHTVRSHASPYLATDRRPPDALRVTSRRRRAIFKRGITHDLAAIFERLNAQYFDGAIDATITWGRASTARRRRPRNRSIRLGSYLASQQLIRIHPVLDDPGVPEFVIASVVHHEMTHAIAPPRPARSNRPGEPGRRRVHTRKFRALERRFEHYDRAQAWIEDHLDELFRRRR